MLIYFSIIFLIKFFGILEGTEVNYISWTPETYPDSLIDLDLCHIRVPSFICDANKLLNDHEEQKGVEYLQTKIEKVRRSTHCPCNHPELGLPGCGHTSLGFTISIAVFSKLHRHTDFVDEIEKKYAMSLFTETLRKRQRRGECEEDIMIALAVDDGIIWTSLGVIAHKIITTELINDISNVADTFFQNGKYTEGLAFMVDTYGKLLRNEDVEINKCNHCIFGIFPIWSIIVIAIVIIIIIIIIFVITVILCKRKYSNKRDSYTLGVRTGNEKVKTKHIIRKETQKDERKI
uniref:TPM domain-containing protein n=1 Tax=Parastrongyloides trichosuri TaxID=131310 RepID=A0A0N4ZSP7_PARTI